MSVFAFVLGAIIGSFLNVCIYRIPRGISVADGRSKCTTCGAVIRWYDLVPIFSYIALRGRCRRCGERISPRYMLVETLTGLLFLLAWLFHGFSLVTPLCMAALSCLVAAAFTDADTMEIPDRYSVIIFILGVAAALLSRQWLSHAIGMVCVSLPFFLVALLTGGIGGGDIKLMAAVGLYLGWKCTLLALVLGSVSGAVWAVWLLARRKAGRKTEVPFGPFLAFGSALSALCGERIIAWYVGLFV